MVTALTLLRRYWKGAVMGWMIGTLIGTAAARWEDRCTRFEFFGHSTGWMGRHCEIPKMLDVQEQEFEQMRQETFKLLCKFEVCT